MTLEIVPLFVTLLTLSLKAAVLVAAIFIVRKLIGKRLSPAWRHGLWILVPLQLLLFVSVPSPWSVQNLWTENIEPVAEESVKNIITIPFSHFERDEATDVSTAANPLPREVPNNVVGASGFSVSLPSPIQIVIDVWLSGAVVMALVFLRQTLLCRKWRREAELVESEAVLHLFKDSARQMKVRTWLVVAESRSVSGPLLIGVIRPILLLPKGLVESATPQQLRTVFLHELAHLKRWDVWIGWLMTALLTLHWFNPLLWFSVRKMNADREEAADELALRTLRPGERPDYGLALIDIAQHYITPARTPGLVGISETGKNLTRRIEMLNQTGTWKLRWKILALMAVFVLGVTTMTDAQTPKRSPAEIQAEIDRLQAELKEVETKEPTIEQLFKNVATQRDFRVNVAQDGIQVDGKKMTLQELVRLLKDEKSETAKTVVLTHDSNANYGALLKVIETLTSQGIENLQFTLRTTESKIGDVPLTLTGAYLGTEGDDRFGIVIGEAKNGPSGNTYPITMYEDGLPGKGYDPNDDDRYEGTAVFVKGKFEITLARKFDGMREEPVEDALKQLTANVVKEIERENRRVEVSNGSALSDGFVLSDGSVRNRISETKIITLTIPKNREWDAVSVSREAKISRDEVRPAQAIRNNADLPGSYLGWEGDDRIGMVLGEAKDGIFPVTIYEDGLPGKGYDPNDDDRYEGTAIVTDGKLEITLLKKFDDGVDGKVEEPVEKPLRKLTATLGSENGKMTLSIPKNREWDAVKLTKTP